MPPPAKPITPAELAALEHAFATDPSSDAYRPLTEAYLAAGRFMEAMVVCKKGVKAHPTDPAPRVLLARIYAAQGKDRKAVEELAAAIQQSPRDVPANRMAGQLLLKLGEKDVGVAALRAAWEAAPQDPETLEAMQAWGLSFTAAAPPAPAGPPPGAPPVPAAPPTAAPVAAAPPPGMPPMPAAPVAPVAQQAAPAPVAPAAVAPQAVAAAPAPVAPHVAEEGDTTAARNAYAEELASKYATREYSVEHPAVAGAPRRHRSHKALLATLCAALAVVVGLLGWWKVRHDRSLREQEIDRLLRQTRELVEKDSYPDYRKAAALCDRILELDPEAPGGHAYLAYIDAVRWGEHGESEGLKDDAQKHLDVFARVAQGQPNAYGAAAAGYLRFYAGDARGAIDALKARLTGAEASSALLHGTLGVLEMRAGDLDGARQELTAARQIRPGDVRYTQMLAEQWRRRGEGYEAQAAALFDTVLTRLGPDHVPSLLGKAQLLIESNHADEGLKRLARVLDPAVGASPRQIVIAHALRGAALHAQGKGAEGDAEEQQALTLDPANGEVYDILGRRKLRANDVPGAVLAFQKAAQLDPARPSFQVDLAGALMRQAGGVKQAIAALEKAAERSGGNARIVKLLGDAYRADGDLDRARAAYERAAGAEKGYLDAQLALARVYRDRREFAKAMDELGKALKDQGEKAPGAAPVYAEMADTLEVGGAPPDLVEKRYTNAIEVDPNSCPALFWLGRSRADRKSRAYDGALAKQMLGSYLRQCPDGARAEEARKLVAKIR